MQYEAIEGSAEEWSNIPKLVAKYCIRLQQHLRALIEHSREMSNQETASSLREFVEDEFLVSCDVGYIFKFRNKKQTSRPSQIRQTRHLKH